MKWFVRLKKSRVFQFVASVKMAVPLMMALAVIVAIGTVIESRYNAQVAALLIYRSGWFEWLLILLGVNVLASALIRFPFHKKHWGFAITHFGLLVLLVGAVMTSELGLDGSLRVIEGQSNNVVNVSEMALKVADVKSGTIKSYRFPKRLEPLNGEQLGFENLRKETGLIIERFLPFIERERSFGSAPGSRDAVVEFTIGSSRFGSSRDWLYSKERPETHLGPTIIKLVIDSDAKGSSARLDTQVQDAIKTSAAAPAVRDGAQVIIRDAQGTELKRVALAALRKEPMIVNQVKISVSRIFEQAIVVDGKLVDKGGRGVNPALEIKLEKAGKVTREFAFAKYPGFSMNQASTAVGLRIDYVLPEIGEVPTTSLPQGHPAIGSKNTEDAAQVDSNSGRIEIHVLPIRVDTKSEAPVRIEFYKNSKLLSKKIVKIGESVETPFMGMTLVLDSVIANAVQIDQVRPIEMVPQGALPESAILLRSEAGAGAEGVWIAEGDYKTVRAGDRSYEVYYGADSTELPFSIFLQKFEKVDYPGTETPMSFQSTVQVNGQGNPIVIKMNEPLKIDGYTLYQSSYETGMGPTASIFSVNKDPGRPVKYVGSLILCLGIVIFSIMKSEWYRKRQRSTKEGLV